IEEAFDVIAGRAAGWSGAPDDREQAELHRAVAQLYRAEHAGWRTLLGAPHELAGDVAETLRGGAERMVGLLPPRLKTSSRWLAAGAVAGALGCVAAATLVTPVAISALPVWSGLGAGLAAAIRVATGGREKLSGDDATAPGEAVRAATLFALVLELQGRGEAAITRILDKTAAAEQEEEIADVRSFLDGVRHRLDLALGEEASA
ncbi:MAG: hypothetical protein ACYTDU_17715, partial [Planctomycetota bacterium]